MVAGAFALQRKKAESECTGMKKMGKRILAGICILAALLLLVAGLMALGVWLENRRINDDYGAILADAAYQAPVQAQGVPLVTQTVSCGYACIQMLAAWQGTAVTEAQLLAQNEGKISTAMGDGFLNESQRQLPHLRVEKHEGLTNSQLLAAVYACLQRGVPVPVELAALDRRGDTAVWTLHFALVTGMDLPGDRITVANPYGYMESYTVSGFLKATRYESYEDMEWFFRLGFAAGLFRQNTCYVLA